MQRLFFFNPDCEMAIANGSPYYTPPARILRMSEDLAFLPAYFGGKEDGVLMNCPPDEEFIKSLQPFFADIPVRVTPEELPGLNPIAYEPWGWSPRTCYLLHTGEWTEERKNLYSRLTAARCLQRMSVSFPWMENDIHPQVCCSMQEIVEYTTNGNYIVKAPWSSSGKGLLPIGQEGVTSKSAEWLSGVLRQQGYVTVEKHLEKCYDFAMEFRADGTQIEFIGFSAFHVGKNREYRGNRVGNLHRIEEEVEGYVGRDPLTSVREQLPEILSAELLPHYQGYFGVDMMIYRNEEGYCKLQPCVEINLRYNMGIVALFLSRGYLAEGTEGVFSIGYFPNEGEAYAHQQKMQTEQPLSLLGGKLKAGYLSLAPVRKDTRFIAQLVLND